MTDPSRSDIDVDLIVIHPQMPDWGPGRVLAVDGVKVTIYFRDIPGEHPEDAIRVLNTGFVALQPAIDQGDTFLRCLPPFGDGKFEHPLKKRVTLEESIEKFRSFYPLFFEDPKYRDDERDYKVAAHEHFEELLGEGQLEQLLSSGDIGEVTSRALSVESRVNLLAVFEKAAFRDGLRDELGAGRFFAQLQQILQSPAIEKESFEAYIHAVESLPSEEGKTSPVKWTVATILPYLAQPDRFMFLKPEVTLDCAARFVFDLHYSPHPNWLTYSRLLEMSSRLQDYLLPYGARDFIDVQSFIWVVGWE